MTRRKGHLDAIEALARLKDRNDYDEILYVVAGPASEAGYLESLRDFAAEKGVRCIFTGRLNDGDLRHLYRISTAHLLTAVTTSGEFEGFGLVTLEAGAQGCATIGTRVCGFSEVIEDGKTGFLCAEGEIAQISSRLNDLLEDGVLQENLSRGAQKRAKEWTWQACAEKTYGLTASHQT